MISISNQELLLQRFHNLHDYLRLTGDHINQIYKRLDDIERKINEMTNEHKMLILANKNEIEKIKEIMIKKSEINGLLQELSSSISGLLPSLPAVASE